jgi:formylglycine-generating enzyme required for sulfatase activity
MITPEFIGGEFKRIAEILVEIHQIKPKPIVHRDLKPANILVEIRPDGSLHYRITDFGIGGFATTQAARVGRLEGTFSSLRNPSLLRGSHSPLYASPEQMSGKDPDPRDDIFSLGVLWYQMQTGRLDSGPPTGFDWSDELQSDQGMSEGMIRLMGACFSSKAEKRPASAKVLIERLDALLTTRPEVKPPPPEPRIEVVSPRPMEQKAPEIITTKIASIPLKLIPGGTFMMGSPDGNGNDDERPQHEVTISTPFYMGIHPVTQSQYARLMGKNPSWFAAMGGGKDKVARMETSRFPVEGVSWFAAAQFCNALSKAEGLDPAYRIDGENVAITRGKGFRLPTEAEWEYACRAGRTSDYGFDGGERELPGYAWFDKNSDQRTHPVGEAKANGFGLHDMHGNVWEWTWDGYADDSYLGSAKVDPIGPSRAVARVFRGGGFGDAAGDCRSAFRNWDPPKNRFGSLGFRLALIR